MAAAAPDYGLLNPRGIRDNYSRAGWTLGFALVLYYINYKEYPGPAAQLAIIIALIAAGFFAFARILVWFSRTGALRVREQLLDSLQLQGTERVLDAGCGLGILGIGAAKRLKSGRVIAVGDTSTNDAARENAKAEGVADKIRFESADLQKLSYPDANFDVVISGLALNTFEHANERTRALLEMVRVLKPGGRLAVHEIGEVSEYTSLLSGAGMKDVDTAAALLPLGLGGRIFTCRK